MTNTPKEYLGMIKLFLERYQADLLKITHRNAGQVVRMRCAISDLINQINFWMGNLPELLKYEFESHYVGMKIADHERYKEKTNTEICESLETQICTTNLPTYIMNPLMFGIWEIKKRDQTQISEIIEDLHFIISGSVESERKGIIKKWEAKKRK